jgi:hypothetical protein
MGKFISARLSNTYKKEIFATGGAMSEKAANFAKFCTEFLYRPHACAALFCYTQFEIRAGYRHETQRIGNCIPLHRRALRGDVYRR